MCFKGVSQDIISHHKDILLPLSLLLLKQVANIKHHVLKNKRSPDVIKNILLPSNNVYKYSFYSFFLYPHLSFVAMSVVPLRNEMNSLMLAARDGYSKVINLLVSHGTDINAQDCNGYTVRHSVWIIAGFLQCESAASPVAEKS